MPSRPGWQNRRILHVWGGEAEDLENPNREEGPKVIKFTYAIVRFLAIFGPERPQPFWRTQTRKIQGFDITTPQGRQKYVKNYVPQPPTAHPGPKLCRLRAPHKLDLKKLCKLRAQASKPGTLELKLCKVTPTSKPPSVGCAARKHTRARQRSEFGQCGSMRGHFCNNKVTRQYFLFKKYENV